MYCPKCGSVIDLDLEKTVNELIICSCLFRRPKVWWDALELDINTEIDWAAKEAPAKEEIPEELDGYCESPWTD